MSISQSIWGIIFDRLKQHSVHHLIIPLLGGIAVEALIHKLVEELFGEDKFFGKNEAVTNFVSTLGFRFSILVLGVVFSWLVVMFFMIWSETNKRIEENALAVLEESLAKAVRYHGVSVIRLTEWFDPALLLYVSRLVHRKLEAKNLRHERTLLFFSDREQEKSKVEMTDEYYYGRCLARLHQDLKIPLSFLTRKDIFDLLDGMGDEEKRALGLYPRWSNWKFLKPVQKVPLRHLRSRIPSLDFALVTNSDGTTTVLRGSKHGERVIIKPETSNEKIKPYEDLIAKIRGVVYESDRLRASHNFLTRYWSADIDWSSNNDIEAQPKTVSLSRREKSEKLATDLKVPFRVRKYSRFVDISERSGDMTVYEQFEGVTAYPVGSSRSKLPRAFTSRFGYLRDPKITKSKGTSVNWEREPTPRSAAGVERGYITFDPPIDNFPVNFELQRTTHNAFHFNQRDRQDRTEQVAGQMDNLNDLYVLKIRFPEGRFPPGGFYIHVTMDNKHTQEQDDRNTDPQKHPETKQSEKTQARKPSETDNDNRNHEEEKRALSRFASFALDRTAVLILEQPLPGHTYRVLWDLPKDDIDEMALSSENAGTLRSIVRRLLSLPSNPAMAQSVNEQLGELQKQIASASLSSHNVNDPGLEVVLHTYDDEKKALVMVAAANTLQTTNSVEIGQSTVGQAYKRRSLVSWVATPNREGRDFWDFGKGHSGIISIPLFFPLRTTKGGRTCVLSIASSLPDSGFLYLIDELGKGDVLRVLTQHVNAWYAKSLAGALGLPDLSKNALNETSSLEEER